MRRSKRENWYASRYSDLSIGKVTLWDRDEVETVKWWRRLRYWWRHLWRDRQHEKDQEALRGIIEALLHDRNDKEWFEARIEESKARLRETLRERLKQ